MFISHYRTDSHLMVHAQPLFCRGVNDTMNYGDALDHATANGVDLQFLEDNEIFRACEDSEHGLPNLFEVEIYICDQALYIGYDINPNFNFDCYVTFNFCN